MYSDLFEHLGGGRGGGVSSSSSQQPAAAPADNPIVRLKAGKLTMVPNPDRGTYTCAADPARGEIRLVCVNNALEWQWYDRRQKRVVDRRVVAAPPGGGSGSGTDSAHPHADDTSDSAAAAMAVDDDNSSAPKPPSSSRSWRLDKVTTLPPRTHKDDRVYVLMHNSAPPADVYDMYWMQDADESKEEEAVQEFNKLLADPLEAVAQHGGGSTDAAPAGTGTSSARGATSGGSAAAAASSAQVDALSSILENLGMPQSSSSDSAGPSGAAATASRPGTNALTLADLQGAMAGIQQQQQRQATAASASAMSLVDVVTPDAVTALLQDEATCARLVELLPEGQRNRESLEDNLRSPQVQQTLRSLTASLLPDDAGRIDGFLSVIANFQLGDAAASHDPSTVQAATTNPIQAFLDAVNRSVQDEVENMDDGEAKADEESKED